MTAGDPNMSEHLEDLSEPSFRAKRLIVIYRVGTERKRVLWSRGETLHFPPPFNCVAVRRDGRISVHKPDGAEIYKLSEERACEDGAEVWVPAESQAARSRQKFHYIHIQPEVELLTAGVFRQKRSRRKRSSNRTRSTRIERPVRPSGPAASLAPRPAVASSPRPSRPVASSAPSVSRNLWNSLWQWSAFAGLGALAIAVAGAGGNSPRHPAPLAPQPAPVVQTAEVAPQAAPAPAVPKSAFSRRSARALKAAIRQAKPSRVASPSKSQRRIAANRSGR